MNINLVFLIALCNATALRGSKIVVSLLALELGASPFAIGLVIAMYAVFPVLMALYAGKLSDRFGTRLPMLLGSAGVACGLLLPALAPTLPALYASAALIGGSYVFYQVSAQNLIGMLGAASADRTRNFSTYSLMLALGSFAGPLCAGVAIDHFGHARTYLLLSLLPVLPVLVMAAARNIKGAADDGAAARDRRVMDLLRSKPLLRVLIVGGIILTGIDLFQFYMPIYGHSIGLSASAIGVIISMFAAAAFAVRLVIPALVARMGEEGLLNLALFIGAGAYLLMPLFTDVAVLCAITFVFGLGLGLGQPLSVMLTFSHSPQGRSGEALGLRLTINNFMHVAVPVVFGTIGSLFGLVPVFWTNALLLAGGGIYSRPRPS